MSGEHAFVSDHPAGQGADVEALVALQRPVGRELRGPADAKEERLPLLLRHTVGKPNEDLLHVRLAGERRLAKALAVVVAHRDLAPAEQLLPELGDGILKDFLARGHRRLVLREEHDACRVLAEGRKLKLAHLAVELVGHGNEHASTIARLLLAAARAAVVEAREDHRRVAHGLVRGLAAELRDEADAARVLFILGVVQALLLRPSIKVRRRRRPRHPLGCRGMRVGALPQPRVRQQRIGNVSERIRGPVQRTHHYFTRRISGFISSTHAKRAASTSETPNFLSQEILELETPARKDTKIQLSSEVRMCIRVEFRFSKNLRGWIDG